MEHLSASGWLAATTLLSAYVTAQSALAGAQGAAAMAAAGKALRAWFQARQESF